MLCELMGRNNTIPHNKGHSPYQPTQNFFNTNTQFFQKPESTHKFFSLSRNFTTHLFPTCTYAMSFHIFCSDCIIKTLLFILECLLTQTVIHKTNNRYTAQHKAYWKIFPKISAYIFLALSVYINIYTTTWYISPVFKVLLFNHHPAGT